MDNWTDSPSGEAAGRWMTLAEIAALRGISKASASGLVRRHRWRRQPDNQGTVRALVPTDWQLKPDSPAEMSGAIEGLREAISAVRDQLERERSRADRAEEGREASAPAPMAYGTRSRACMLSSSRPRRT